MNPGRSSLILLILVFMVSACSSPNPGRSGTRGGGGYYGGDGPPDDFQDIESIPDAIPQNVPQKTATNRPYKVLGKQYYPLKTAKGFVQTGVASWYGKKFHGRQTASGERYDMWKMTAAHPTLPIPTWVKVTSLDQGNSIIVKINDRGPFLHSRIIDLSYVAAQKLGIARKGSGRVRVSAIDPTTYKKPSEGTEGPADAKPLETSDPDGIFLQIGAYESLLNAVNMLVWLKVQGFNVYPESEQQLKSNGYPYRVQTGPYSATDAREIQRFLQKLLNQSILMVTR